MYTIDHQHAISNASQALASIAEHFAIGARDSNGTSVTARQEAALRVRALEALEALATIDAGPEPVDPRVPANVMSTMTPLAELLIERGFDPSAPEPDETPIEILAASLPALAGGSLEPWEGWEPTESDWEDYARHRDAADERERDALHFDMFGY